MNWHQQMDKALEQMKSSGAAAAEPLLLKAMELAADNAEHKSMTYFNLGLVLYDLKRPKEAEQSFVQALELMQDYLPNQNELYGMMLKTIIEFYEKENRFAESKKYCLMEIEHTRNMFGAKHPFVANMMCELSGILIKSGEFVEAEKHLCKSLDIMTSTRGPDHPQNATIHSHLATCYLSLGRHDDAEYHKTRAKSLQERALRQSGKFDQTSGTAEQSMD